MKPVSLMRFALLACGLLGSSCASASGGGMQYAAAPATAREQGPAAPPTGALPELSKLSGISRIDPSYFPICHLALDGGESEVLAPDVIALGTAVNGGTGQFAYAVYDGELSSFNFSGLSFAIDTAPDLNSMPGSYWLAVSNFDLLRWDWYGPFDDADSSLRVSDPGKSHANGWGHVFIAVVPEPGSGCTVQQLQWSDSGLASKLPPTGDHVLSVGPGQTYSRVEDALAAAELLSGIIDILVYPQTDNTAYAGTALFVDIPNLRLWGIRTGDNRRPILSGTGFDYTGVGSTPRAIVQFQPEANQCELHGFELTDAHNSDYNGAGVRVNQATQVQVDDCWIHGCDMGLMSNGDAGSGTGGVLISESRIYENGSFDDPGYNHNIYAGGTYLVMNGCEVYGALTGHNVKSRAHTNNINACFIHDSANRELDLVDEAGNTDIPGTYSILVGCVIEKADPIDGNKAVIHYGQDGGHDHSGPLYVVNCDIITPYISPVVDLSAPGASVTMYSNIIWDAGSGQSGQTLVNARDGALIASSGGSHNWLSAGFSLPAGAAFDAGTTYMASSGEDPPFEDATTGDYRLLPGTHAGITMAGLSFLDSFPTPTDGNGNIVAIFPANVYRPPSGWFVREPLSDHFDVGAYQGRP